MPKFMFCILISSKRLLKLWVKLMLENIWVISFEFVDVITEQIKQDSQMLMMYEKWFNLR